MTSLSEMIVFSFHFVAIFQVHEPTNLEENTRSPRHWRRKTSFKSTNPKHRKKQMKMLLHQKIEVIDDMQRNLFAEDRLERSLSN